MQLLTKKRVSLGPKFGAGRISIRCGEVFTTSGRLFLCHEEGFATVDRLYIRCEAGLATVGGLSICYEALDRLRVDWLAVRFSLIVTW